MKAMQLKESGFSENLNRCKLLSSPPQPSPRDSGAGVSLWSVHTELDVIEGRTPPPRFPMILGHQIGCYVVESTVTRLSSR